MKKTWSVLLLSLFLMALCACGDASQKKLPAPETDPSADFGVDKNIHMSTIDRYLDRDDVYYRDVRMLFDPADYAAIGGEAIFLMCGGGGYAGMTKQLLIFLGWDPSTLYNVGANWTYAGENRLELVVYPEGPDGTPTYATWRADYAYFEFERLNPLP